MALWLTCGEVLWSFVAYLSLNLADLVKACLILLTLLNRFEKDWALR